jgi:hypothetical protein
MYIYIYIYTYLHSYKCNMKIFQVRGFVDLGEHTTPGQKTQIGDHGLVFMFQSYTGKWVQVLGCFLSKGCANGDTLAKLTTECILLLENAGYKVDGVVTDGASWNHNMWGRFGVGTGSGRNMKTWCEHPADTSRKLFFFSDFPHLLKCLRNNLLERKFFKVSENNICGKPEFQRQRVHHGLTDFIEIYVTR